MILSAILMYSEGKMILLLHLFIFRGIPEHLGSDNGPEFTFSTLEETRALIK
jgi:hypothetical protein